VQKTSADVEVDHDHGAPGRCGRPGRQVERLFDQGEQGHRAAPRPRPMHRRRRAVVVHDRRTVGVDDHADRPVLLRSSSASPRNAVVPRCKVSRSNALSGVATRTHVPPPVVSMSLEASMLATYTLTLATESYGNGASVSNTRASGFPCSGDVVSSL